MSGLLPGKYPAEKQRIINEFIIDKMKTKLKTSMALLASALLWVSCAGGGGTSPSAMDPVDYVNPYMGNISHLLVPTFPTVHLPNSMLRV